MIKVNYYENAKMEESRANILRHMQICRFCLNPDKNLTSIYDSKYNKKNTVPLPLQLMACVAIEVFQNDGMPQLICEDCRNLAVQAYTFKGNCKKADDALKLFLATGNFTKPFGKNDFQNYLPKGKAKIRPVQDILPTIKRIKLEPEQSSDADVQAQDGEQEVQEYEIEPASNNEYNVKMVTSSPKPKNVSEVKTVRTDCFPCTLCEKSFSLKQLLDLHLQKHSRPRNFKCEECSRTFFSKYDLAKHQLTHTEEEGQFSCVVCKKEFSRESNLHRHEKTHSDAPEYACVYCDNSFLNKDDLIAHTRRKHGKKRPFTCNECGKSFVFKQGLERHILIHKENKPHKCNYCEASFTSPIKLTRHVTSHAGLRPYPCKLCKRTFLLSHHLTRHMRSHYAAKSNNVRQIGQHKCDICSMSFRRKDSLINHSAIHSMVNLKCVICYTEFDSAQAVKDHITTHLSGLPFPCEKCDYSFETKDQLEEHEVKHAEMEYEEQIEKEVVEEARAQGQLAGGSDNGAEVDDDDDDEFGGDHMGRNGEDDDYQDEDDDVAEFSIANMNGQTVLRRSDRKPKAKTYTDFLKDEIETEDEDDDENNQQEDIEVEVETHKTADQGEPKEDIIKPIFRTEGTKVYKRKTPVHKPKIVTTIPQEKVKTAPLSQINQPQVTTIENLGLTTQDLQDLPTEKYVNMKIGNKTVRVQKLVLTKEEMKAMAKEGKIRGNTVLIKNPGHISNVNRLTNSVGIPSILNESKTTDSPNRPLTKTYKKRTVTEACNAAVVGRDSVIINDVIIDNIDDDDDHLPEAEMSNNSIIHVLE